MAAPRPTLTGESSISARERSGNHIISNYQLCCRLTLGVVEVLQVVTEFVRGKDAEVAEKDATIAEMNRSLEEKDGQIQDLEGRVDDLERRLATVRKSLNSGSLDGGYQTRSPSL